MGALGLGLGALMCLRNDGARNPCQGPGVGGGSSFFGSLGLITLSEDMPELQSIFLFLTSYLLFFVSPFCSPFLSSLQKTKEVDQWSVWSTLVLWIIILVCF